MRRLSNSVKAIGYSNAGPDIGYSNGAYVISGGLGYIGRLVVKALIKHGAHKMVLLSSSRSTLPDGWEGWRPDGVKCDAGRLCEVRRDF